MATLKIKKGDTVKVIAGKDKDKEGKVLSIKDGKAIVEGINMVTKHAKPSMSNQQGGIINKEAPIDLSNLMVMYKGKATRVGFKVEDGKKVRKKTNHAGGSLGGLSDGSPLILRAAVKPTSSISRMQNTVNEAGEDTEILVKGRHDPLIVPRAVVVVESMTAITLADLLLQNMCSRIDNLRKIYTEE